MFLKLIILVEYVHNWRLQHTRNALMIIAGVEAQFQYGIFTPTWCLIHKAQWVQQV